MKILFCSDPLDGHKPDFDYEDEYEAAVKNGFIPLLFSYEDLLYEDKLNIKQSEGESLIYRGWMLTPAQYANLYQKLANKGYRLINNPKQYQNAHYLPEWYDLISDITPTSVWTNDYYNEHIIKKMLQKFNNHPIIVKDYVKSRKHEWFESCYIPDASDTKQALQIIHNFIKKQDEFLNEGIVLREFIRLNENGLHPKSKMPISEEYRIFILNGKILSAAAYWDGLINDQISEDCAELIERTKIMDSNFYTIDFAHKKDGSWCIMEIGDGQVSGLQEYNPDHFYQSMSEVSI